MGHSFLTISLGVRRLLVGGSVVAALACGSSSSNGSNDVAADSSHVSAFCQAQCDHDPRCGNEPDADCTSRCHARLPTPSLFSQQALAIYTECMNDPACLDDDVCEDRVQQRSPAIDRAVKDCTAFVRSCPFEGDISACLRIAWQVPDLRARLARCYVGTCTYDSLSECVSKAYSG